MTAAMEISQDELKDRILMALYKHRGIGTKAATELGLSAAKFKKTMESFEIDLAGFKNNLKEFPEFADLMEHYATNGYGNSKSEAMESVKEAQLAVERPSDGRSVADVEAITVCPHCGDNSKQDLRTFGVGLFISRMFGCKTTINRSGNISQTNRCKRIEERNGTRS